MKSIQSVSEPAADVAWEHFRQSLEQWCALGPEDWASLRTVFRSRKARAGTTVGLPGDTRHRLFYVAQGMFRLYYLDDDGKERNKAFVMEGKFAGAWGSSLLAAPVNFGIEALEDAVWLEADYPDFLAALECCLPLERIARKIAEQFLMHMELRSRNLLMKDATERYEDFLARYAENHRRIPQYHIASYLGMTEVSLSRIRGARNRRTS